MLTETATRGDRPRGGRIELRGVTVEVGEGADAFAALCDLDLTVAPGELVCVLGPSGCGKSTLLGAIAGFLPVARGEITVDGAPVARPGADRGMVFQQHTLLPWRSALDNVAFGLALRGGARCERRARAAALLAVVGLQGFEKHYPAQLSGGMQQRVELARALLNRPPVLLMDEPFGALDSQTRLDMQALLLEVWERLGATVVFVTHDVDEAVFLGDRVLVMTRRPGQLRAEIPIPLRRPRTPEALAANDFLELRRRCLSLVREEARRGPVQPLFPNEQELAT
jgi:NitT/TauT family transport system ATP-binding protein